VLVRLRNPQSEPVWLGFYDGQSWVTVDGWLHGPRGVTHWAEMPAGPLYQHHPDAAPRAHGGSL
jgi:hypothetical protein